MSTYIASVIYYHLTIVPCSSLYMVKLEHFLFCLLWKGWTLLVRCSICCQHSMNSGLGMQWLLISKHAPRLQHIQCSLDSGEQKWLLFIRLTLPQLTSLSELQSQMKCRPKLGSWHLESGQALRILSQSSKAVRVSSTMALYRGLVVKGNNDILGEILGVDEFQLASLFQRTLSWGLWGNFQKPLAWQCYKGTLPVRDKLYKHRSVIRQTCPRCVQSNKTILPTLIQYPSIFDIWLCAKHLLSHV